MKKLFLRMLTLFVAAFALCLPGGAFADTETTETPAEAACELIEVSTDLLIPDVSDPVYTLFSIGNEVPIYQINDDSALEMRGEVLYPIFYDGDPVGTLTIIPDEEGGVSYSLSPAFSSALGDALDSNMYIAVVNAGENGYFLTASGEWFLYTEDFTEQEYGFDPSDLTSLDLSSLAYSVQDESQPLWSSSEEAGLDVSGDILSDEDVEYGATPSAYNLRVIRPIRAIPNCAGPTRHLALVGI